MIENIDWNQVSTYVTKYTKEIVDNPELAAVCIFLGIFISFVRGNFKILMLVIAVAAFLTYGKPYYAKYKANIDKAINKVGR